MDKMFTKIKTDLKKKSRNERRLYLDSLKVADLKIFYKMLTKENDIYKTKDHDGVEFNRWLDSKSLGSNIHLGKSCRDESLYREHIVNALIKYRSTDTIKNLITIKDYIDVFSKELVKKIRTKEIKMLIFVDGDQATSTLTHINSVLDDGLHIIVTQRNGSSVPPYIRNKRWCTIIHTNDKGKNSSDMMICLEITTIILKLKKKSLKPHIVLITNDHFGEQYVTSISTLYDIILIDPKKNEGLALYLLKHYYDDVKFNRYGNELKKVMDGLKTIDVIEKLRLQEDFKDLIKRFMNLKKIKSSTFKYPIYQHMKETIYNNSVLIDIKRYIMEKGHVKISTIEKLFPVDVAILCEHNCKTVKSLLKIPQISYFLRCEITKINSESVIRYLKDISLPIIYKRVGDMSLHDVITLVRGHWDFEEDLTKTCQKYDLDETIITKILFKHDTTLTNLARCNLINFKVWLIDNYEKNMKRCGGSDSNV